MKNLLFSFLLLFNISMCFAEEHINKENDTSISIFQLNEKKDNIFPNKIKNYNLSEDKLLELSNEKSATLQLILFDKNQLNISAINQNDLIIDTEDLNKKVNEYFTPKIIENKIKKKNKKGKLIEIIQKEESEKTQGILLITKYFFIGKDKPYEINNEDSDLKEQIYKESQCNDGICLAHIILGINLFDDEFNIKNLDIKDFSKTLNKNDNIMIKSNYNEAENSILKVYYFYGLNGSILPNNKLVIKKLIKDSKN